LVGLNKVFGLRNAACKLFLIGQIFISNLQNNNFSLPGNGCSELFCYTNKKRSLAQQLISSEPSDLFSLDSFLISLHMIWYNHFSSCILGLVWKLAKKYRENGKSQKLSITVSLPSRAQSWQKSLENLEKKTDCSLNNLRMRIFLSIWAKY